MKIFVALMCALSLVFVTPAAIAADQSHQDQQERRADERRRGWTQVDALEDEARRLDEESRRALTRELRALAGAQVLRPVSPPLLWDLLGTQDGVEWAVLGTFFLLESDPPPAKSTDRVPMRFVVGDVLLTDGREVANVVASVADVGPVPGLGAGSLLFVAHDVGEDRARAVTQSERLARQAGRVASVDVGDTPGSQSADSFGSRTSELSYVECATACRNTRVRDLEQCDSEAVVCAGLATTAFAVCSALCTVGTSGLCIPACWALYTSGLVACDATKQICVERAEADNRFCLGQCDSLVPEQDGCLPECGSPIVIDLDGREGFRFTDASAGVIFDLDADGLDDHTAWTAPGHRQAFLVLDRNGNGTIDDGSELFGDVTEQPMSSSPNGFFALALFDERSAGGDGDGLIGPPDAVFDLLRLWIDENHDGRSQPEELWSLSDAGIEHLELDYVVSNRRDRHGNLLRYKALVQKTDRKVECTDVFFLFDTAVEDR